MNRKIVVLMGILVFSTGWVANGQLNKETLKRFEKGVRLKADSKLIDVVTGHAAPSLYDFNSDGKLDLIVGEFGSGRFKGETTSDSSMANARVRIYLNQGTSKKPKYDEFTYLKAGGKTACVPNT